MNTSIRHSALLLSLSLATGLAQAQTSGISWTYVDAAYQSTEFDLGGLGDVDGDGALIGGSLAIGNYLHVLGGWQRSSLDKIVLGSSLIDLGDSDQFAFGFGVHSPMTKGAENRLYSDRFSAFLDGRFLSSDSDAGPDRDGWALDAGARIVNFTAWEFIGSVGYEKFESVDGELTLKGRLLYRLFDQLQLQGGVDWNDNRTQWFLGARYNFPGFSIF